MGRIGVLQSFLRVVKNAAKLTDVKVDRGGGDARTVDHFSSPGDDSHPLPGDQVALVGQAGTGRESAVGYIDTKNTQSAGPGDKRVYARNGTGDQVCEVWLKSDGSISGVNANGAFSLQSGGNFVVNGVTIDTAGNITSPATVTGAKVVAPVILADGKDVANHNHPAGTVPGNTGNNN